MAVYYVDFTTGDDADTGLTEALAWKTVAKVNSSMSSFVAGDSILFKRGETWTNVQLTIAKGGSATNNRITFGRYGTSGANPLFSGGVDGAGVLCTAASVDHVKVEYIDGLNCGIAFLGNDRHDIVVDHCNVTGGNNPFFFTRIDGITVTFCTASGHTGGGITFYGAAGATVQICNGLVEDCVVSGGSDCFGIHPDDTLAYNPGDNFTFRRCVGSGASEQAFDLGKNLAAIDNLLVENCEASDSAADGGMVICAINSIIRYNYIHDNGRYGLRLAYATSHTDIYYNIFENNAREDLQFSTTAGANIHNINFYNNTLIGDASKTYSSIYPRTNSGLDYFVVKNNIVVNNYTKFVEYEGAMTLANTHSTFNNNCYYDSVASTNKFSVAGTLYNFAGWQGLGADAAGMFDDPLFISATDFHLTGISPCLDAGLDVGLTTDYAGNPIC